ncbi:ribonuclease H [Trifolium pratense]|uniref:Ribonuclease H n=1 Tax=Trifolium pratense TaxID=57577 RepID=A0A2K3PAW7_TRIPR|nr:ribonuclease H [Trifolium pratense]
MSCTIVNVDGFSGFIVGSTDILYAELLAIYHGLSLAKDLGHDHIACYSDSLNSLNLIQYSIPRFHIYAVLIQNIKDLLLGFGTTTLIHSLREGNSCADFMAKLGASSNVEVLIHSSPPPGLRDLLAADSLGVSFLRA